MSRKLLSKLSYLVITTPKLDESLKLYRDILGLEVSGQKDQSVFLRGWGENYKHSIELVEGPQPSLQCIGWRAAGEEELEIAVRRLEESGRGLGWVEPGFGRGRAYRYRGPGGHLHEIFWEVERYQAPPELSPAYPNRPQLYVPRGAAVREIDHVTVNTLDVIGDIRWYSDTLGYRFMEYIKDKDGYIFFGMLTTGERGHDMALVPDVPGNSGRVNHISFWCDQRVELHRAADVLIGAGYAIEFGPGRHGLGEQEYLYFREPSGLRIELNAGGYRNSDPDWSPVGWTLDQGANVWYRNLAMPRSMFESFPPPVEVNQQDAEAVMDKTKFFV